MGRRRYHTERRRRKTGRGLPYGYRNRVYFGKRQTGESVVSKVLAHLLQNVCDIIGI